MSQWEAVRLYPLQPLCKRPAKVLEGHDILAVLEARPADDKSDFLLASAAAADRLGSRLLFEFVTTHTFGC
jgi:hypothetical protein